MLKIVYQICCGMDVNKSFLATCIELTDSVGVTAYKSKRFLPLQVICEDVPIGPLKTTVLMFVWNHRANTRFRLTTFLNPPAMSFLLTLNMLKLFAARKPTRKMLNGLLAFSSTIQYQGNFIPPTYIRQLSDLVRYHNKLTNYTTGEKNRVQNCLTVSNIKLDDVFSDVFGKASSNIISYMLDNPNDKITDVSKFRTKHMKSSDEQILNAIDCSISYEQAEKLKIIREHMDNLELCKANTMSLILNLVEKYLPQLNLILTVPGISTFWPYQSFQKSVLICPCFQPLRIYALGLVLLLNTMIVRGKRKLLVSEGQALILSLCLFSAPFVPFVKNPILKSEIVIYT